MWLYNAPHVEAPFAPALGTFRADRRQPFPYRIMEGLPVRTKPLRGGR
jgi:hypothetical protein